MKKNVDVLLNEEKAKLADLEGKKAAIDKKIKTTKANIERLTYILNQEKVCALTSALDSKGLDFDDVLSALQSGDLATLQNKLNNAEDNRA